MRVFQAASGAREAADHDLELAQRGEIGPERRDLLERAERHERVSHAVVVSLDGKLGPARRFNASQERFRLAGTAPTLGSGWLIRPNTIFPLPSRSSSTGTMPLFVSSSITPRWSEDASTHAVPETRMPGERKLGPGREDADPDRAALLRRQHERRLGEPDLERERLHRLLVDRARVREDGKLVSLERRSVKTSATT